LQHYSNEQASEIAKRMTNLFRPSCPVEVRIKNQTVFLDSNLMQDYNFLFVAGYVARDVHRPR